VEHKSGCAFCGKELQYLDRAEELHCIFCNRTFSTEARCVDGHFVCDACHALSANDLIERFTIASDSTDPVAMALTLMKAAPLKMHGPEHHFLVPAVLLAAFYNMTGPQAEKETRIRKARRRAEHVLGGFCGFYGACGAAVGTGIFMSIMTEATPLSHEEWRLANLVTADSLHTIALAGGPRCCKRNSFLALLEAVRFVKEHFQVALPSGDAALVCEFMQLNEECKKEDCRFYPAG
jgi:hypothetical protein